VTDLAPDVRVLPNVVAATELEAFAAAVRTAAAGGTAPTLSGGPLAQGEIAIAWLGPEPRAWRFRLAKRRVQHRRHVRKYTEGELPPDRSFYFRGPAGALFGPPGYELNLLYLAGLAALVLGGSGPLAIDGLLSRRRSA